METDWYETSEPDDSTLFDTDMKTAKDLIGRPLYVPVNCDWRGRFYGIPFFNFQRQDWVRALFRFAQEIGKEGLRWLKIHCASLGNKFNGHGHAF